MYDMIIIYIILLANSKKQNYWKPEMDINICGYFLKCVSLVLLRHFIHNINYQEYEEILKYV